MFRSILGVWRERLAFTRRSPSRLQGSHRSAILKASNNEVLFSPAATFSRHLSRESQGTPQSSSRLGPLKPLALRWMLPPTPSASGVACRSPSTPTCCGTAAATNLPARDTIPEGCKRGSGTETFSIRCAIPGWRPIGSGISGGGEGSGVFPVIVYYSRNRFPADTAMVIGAGAMIRRASNEYVRWRP
jgi:hypothetical protein